MRTGPRRRSDHPSRSPRLRISGRRGSLSLGSVTSSGCSRPARRGGCSPRCRSSSRVRPRWFPRSGRLGTVFLRGRRCRRDRGAAGLAAGAQVRCESPPPPTHTPQILGYPRRLLSHLIDVVGVCQARARPRRSSASSRSASSSRRCNASLLRGVTSLSRCHSSSRRCRTSPWLTCWHASTSPRSPSVSSSLLPKHPCSPG